MKTITTLIFATCLLFQFTSFGQHACGFDHALQKLAEKHDSFEHECQAFYERAVRESKTHNSRATVYQVPVVFHVVWNNDDQNLSDEVILDQLEILNRDFRRMNEDADQTRPEFLPVAADAEIEFVLATTDPDGNPTDGINRVETDREGFEFDLFSADFTIDEVKSSETGGVDTWGNLDYMNVWICNIEASVYGQIFGFAYPPNNAPNWEGLLDFIEPEVDGIVMHYTTVGSNNPTADDDGFSENNEGRTMVHEVGHFLGLRHTWGDGFFNGCEVDDGMTDTPMEATAANYNCDFNLNTCDEGMDDLPDQIENYMDYNVEACLNMFTEEQVGMMRFILEDFRPELIEGQIVDVEETNQLDFTVYPNPSKGEVTIKINSNQNYIVYDIFGKQVDNGRLQAGTQMLDFNHLSAGVYLIKVGNNSPVELQIVE